MPAKSECAKVEIKESSTLDVRTCNITLTAPASDFQLTFDPKLGPFFRLQEGIPHKYFHWRSVWQRDSEMYPWLREHIYKGRSLLGLYWICFLPLPVIVIAGMIASAMTKLQPL